ncbi:hypothetical protein VTO42DRAFT_8716 [Malbranchea cinnamomea]
MTSRSEDERPFTAVRVIKPGFSTVTAPRIVSCYLKPPQSREPARARDDGRGDGQERGLHQAREVQGALEDGPDQERVHDPARLRDRRRAQELGHVHDEQGGHGGEEGHGRHGEVLLRQGLGQEGDPEEVLQRHQAPRTRSGSSPRPRTHP